MKVFNSQTMEKEQLQTIEPGKVKIYSCGPTVYNYFHIGNARPFIVFDTLRRYLVWRGYDVTFVQNFTDIDDKMINKANAEGISVQELGERFIKEYYTDADALGIKHPDFAPKATDHINEIIGIIENLIKNGLAYEIEGDVYYDVLAFKDYGHLSGQKVEDLLDGARINVDEKKKSPMDFALWKSQKPGEPAWQSPWGMGRPGWHIECSAMSMKYLGEQVDIHCGGQDLIFPHHENEVAQSEGATGKPFVKYWMHNGYININNQKMSKSLGNFFTVRDIAAEFDLMVVRMFMLSAHYRNPINFSKDLITQTKAAYERLTNCYEMLKDIGKDASPVCGVDSFEKELEGYKTSFIEAMDDDLNTADAIGVIFDMVRTINTHFIESKDAHTAAFAKAKLQEICDVLGLNLEKGDSVPQEIVDLAEKRVAAKKAKDYSLADEIRGQIKDLGYTMEDSREGYKLKKD